VRRCSPVGFERATRGLLASQQPADEVAAEDIEQHVPRQEEASWRSATSAAVFSHAESDWIQLLADTGAAGVTLALATWDP